MKGLRNLIYLLGDMGIEYSIHNSDTIAIVNEHENEEETNVILIKCDHKGFFTVVNYMDGSYFKFRFTTTEEIKELLELEQEY